MNATLLHVLVVCDAMIAAGFTVTVTVNGVPVHVPVADVGVTLYVAVTALAVLLLRLSVRMLLAVPDVPPVRPVPRVGAAHAYVVLAGIVPDGA